MMRRDGHQKSPDVAGPPPLKGRKVVLRGKRLSDAAQDYAWRTDAELAGLDAVAPLTLPFGLYLLNYAQELNYLASGRHFAIEDAAGKHIGNCMYYAVDEGRGEAELGILIGDRDYWDQGYGQDAIVTLVDHVFSAMRLNRIYLHTLRTNLRAQQCFRKCGFVECGHTSKDGHDFVVLEILRRQWSNITAMAQG